jgi:hypothetical protein
MPQYTYTALDCKGEQTEGTIEAVSESEAITQLRQQGYYPTKLDKATGKTKSTGNPTPREKPKAKELRNPFPFQLDLSAWSLQKLVATVGIVCFLTGFILGIIVMTMANNKPNDDFREDLEYLR